MIKKYFVPINVGCLCTEDLGYLKNEVSIFVNHTTTKDNYFEETDVIIQPSNFYNVCSSFQRSRKKPQLKIEYNIGILDIVHLGDFDINDVFLRNGYMAFKRDGWLIYVLMDDVYVTIDNVNQYKVAHIDWLNSGKITVNENELAIARC